MNTADLTRLHVERGAEFLDKTKPGWAALVNTETLNIEDGWQCIAGQVFAVEAAQTWCSNGFYYASVKIPGFDCCRMGMCADNSELLWIEQIQLRVDKWIDADDIAHDNGDND